jgi:DNA helicase-2/ATP-dependent DNA helicase PcrA
MIESLGTSLNERQKEAVLATEGPLMVLAGAGSGKTKMLTCRIAHLVQKGVAPHQILAVTFTNKAAGEMRERVEKLLMGTSALSHPEIGTFHSVCLRILRRELQATSYTQPFVIYDDSEQLALVKSVVQKLGIDEKAFNPKSFQAAINRAKCDAIDPEDIEPAAHNLFEKHFKTVYGQYQKDLVTHGAIDFGEILCLTYRVFRDHPEVRARYQSRYRYIHVDEYQDTNRVQYLLLNLLAGREHGGHENICVVGDEDQSIYKWRGADISNILDFESQYRNAQVIKLEQNYRSTQNIITVASQVISNNSQRKDKQLWTANPEGDRVIRVQLADERAEAEMVISEIKRQAEKEGRSFSEFAIFYRTHAQSRQFEDLLRREKIQYQIIGGLRFYDRKEIKDILSYFKLIFNLADSVSLKRVINVPARGIGKTTIEACEQAWLGAEEGSTLFQVVEREALMPQFLKNAAAKKIRTFVELIQTAKQKSTELKLSELYHWLLDETGYVRELKQEGTEEALARVENLEEFDSLLQEFEEDQAEVDFKEHLGIFLEQSTLDTEADRAARDVRSGLSAVQMMSLHSSKGLEFPVVFMVGMEEGLFPSTRAWEETSEEDIEEERRLCYVGMTRARERLYLSHVLIRRLWGNVNYQDPARFFLEMPLPRIEMRDYSQGQASSQYRLGSARTLGYSDSQGSIPKARAEASVIGLGVNHPDFGMGRIVLSEGSAPDLKIIAEFRGGDRRKFLYKFIERFVVRDDHDVI